ncbi:hypothetical protein [Devosia lacusdianchii]|nr:hypothetical protein [Devosia sp. JXJ CY 41]
MDPRTPINLPDDFGIDETRADLRMASWAAATLAIVFGIAALIIFGAFA